MHVGFRDVVGGVKCPMDPFFIVPDKCSCVDYQVTAFLDSVGEDEHWNGEALPQQEVAQKHV